MIIRSIAADAQRRRNRRAAPRAARERNRAKSRLD